MKFPEVTLGVKNEKDLPRIRPQKIRSVEVEDFQGLASDEMQFLEDDAIEYLENFAPDGHWVGYNEGDFGVWPIVEDD